MDDEANILMPDNRTLLPKEEVFGKAEVHVCADQLVHADEWTELQPIEGWRFEGRWNTLPRAIETRTVTVTVTDKKAPKLVLARYDGKELQLDLTEFFPNTTQYDFDSTSGTMIVKRDTDGVLRLDRNSLPGWRVVIIENGWVQFVKDDK